MRRRAYLDPWAADTRRTESGQRRSSSRYARASTMNGGNWTCVPTQSVGARWADGSGCTALCHSS
eukprot:8321644-Lingulodinium_polyedra.AAC.1